MNPLKYLLLVPLHNGAHLLPFFFASLRKMNPKPDYIVWYPNNNTDDTVQTLKTFQDIPSEILEFPDFPSDFAKQNGAFEAISIVRQRLWERARELNSEWTFMCDQDHFTVSPDLIDILSTWNVDFVVTPQMRLCHNTQPPETSLDAWYSLNGKVMKAHPKFYTYDLIPHKLTVCRIAEVPRMPLMPNMKLVHGFYCFSRRLVQDRRQNWNPMLPTDSIYYSDDTAFAYSARKLGYNIHCDGLGIIDHLIYDGIRGKEVWEHRYFVI